MQEVIPEIIFKTQTMPLEIDVLDRTTTDKKDVILAVIYGKNIENQNVAISRQSFTNMINTNKLSEYDIASHIFTLQLSNGVIYQTIIKQQQRQIFNNTLLLIHMDFMVINDDSVIPRRRISINVSNQDLCQDYKNGCILHAKREINMPKDAKTKVKDMPVKAIVNIEHLRKNESLSYANQCIVSLTKR